jgi:hypothetical protein
MRDLKSTLATLLLMMTINAFSQSTAFVTPLKSFEGYYTMNFGSQTAYLQISATADGVKLKQLWDQKEIVFARKSDLNFEGENGTFPLNFSKGADGVVSQVTAFNRDLWTRTKDYKPVTQTYKPTSKDLKLVEGKYRVVSSGDNVQFYSENGNLLAKQLWDGKVHHMLAQTGLKYTSQEAGITATFVKNDKGEIVRADLSQGDVLEKIKE